MFLIFSSILILGLFTHSSDAQQLYVGNSVFGCDNTDAGGPPAYLYSCNGEKHSCQAFLIFRSKHKYNSITTISNLTSVSPQELGAINNVSVSAVLPHGKEVIVPVNCSCSGQYYQANTSYIIHNSKDTYFSIASKTYQGLSTCEALVRENPYNENDLELGLNLRVPLRCACPTKNQTKEGVKFLLTYLVAWNDNAPDISHQFNVTTASVANANSFSEEHQTIFPFTTILIPLPTKPSSSQTIIHPSPVPDRPPFTPLVRKFSNTSDNSYKGIYIGIAVGSTLSVICCCLFLLFSYYKSARIDRGQDENRRMKKFKQPENIRGNIAKDDQMLKIYEFEEVEAATESFASKKRLSACVYRGVLRGNLMAIKKACKYVKNEVQILQKLNHFNVIRLCGACQRDGVYYLVYEFMENGSLKEWLQNNSKPEIHSLKVRIGIALDVASGLEYLHNFTSPSYVHKNLNSSNILLNGDLRAKITNFSFARSADQMKNGNSSSPYYQGTKGYTAPEYIETGEVTPKIDVYAFGVILLELITGKEVAFEQDGKEVFPSETGHSITDGRNAENAAAVANLIDPRLQMIHPLGYIIDQTEVATRLMKLSAACLAPEAGRRLRMAEVASSLSEIQLDVQNHDPLSIE